MPVWLANDEPNAMIRSASFMNQLAMGVPERPSTPPACGCVSAIRPFPLKVVTTTAPMRSARVMTASRASTAPCPITISGRRAELIIATACARSCAAGTTTLPPSRPVGPPAGDVFGTVCTSSGKTRCATSRSTSADLQASDISSACFELGNTVCEKRDTAWKAECRSMSWKAPGPNTWVCTCPVKASTGARSTLASHSPVNRLVAPGPAIVRQAAGRPVSLPYADAAKAAAPSWRTPT